MTSPLARRAAAGLGLLYLALGVAEVVTRLDASLPALLFWAVSLLGGGSPVVAGVLTGRTHPVPGVVLVVLGAVLGLPATAWTLLVPAFAVTVVVLALRDLSGQEPNASA